ncbi:DUF397 domain-containing protein [Nocardiopsis sp. RSe5-2]|uniref:DUF397 domain-containing protein n=1 Tax=Nocardiopsis endophytica TaxID=3018445 RepID=A0ABT4U3F4_9ACTN|nr:DUF397 domain-containing protein [Nocardiopsis endophytica]MDA2810867.1 DUF397 domain-containing protein [Nocardiopsis endophytica]
MGWRKSSYSQGASGCLECAAVGVRGRAVRDTKNRDLGHLAFGNGEWAAFLRSLQTEVF